MDPRRFTSTTLALALALAQGIVLLAGVSANAEEPAASNARSR